MSLVYVIDGYNIIKSPHLASVAKKNARFPQRSFLSYIKVQKLTGSQKNRVIVVFDGFPPVDMEASEREHEGIEFLFSGSLSADERIQRLADKAENPRNVVVVTDDRQLQFSVRAAGAAVIGAREFLRVEKQERSPRARIKKPKGSRRQEEDTLSYSQQEKINQELRRLWLK